MLPTVAKALAGGGGEGGITVKRASLCFTVIPLGGLQSNKKNQRLRL
jgi:hypothetical protein